MIAPSPYFSFVSNPDLHSPPTRHWQSIINTSSKMIILVCVPIFVFACDSVASYSADPDNGEVLELAIWDKMIKLGSKHAIGISVFAIW